MQNGHTNKVPRHLSGRRVKDKSIHLKVSSQASGLGWLAYLSALPSFRRGIISVANTIKYLNNYVNCNKMVPVLIRSIHMIKSPS